MNRDYRFDISRVVCMTYIVAFVHLYSYIYTDVVSAAVIPECAVLTDSCLGLFTFLSGYLLGVKYSFTDKWLGVWLFYKKRLLRIVPLFLVASIVLYLIGFNNAEATLNGMLCISPFITPRPMTMWYIPVILFCYLITPLVCRKNFTWRLISSLMIIIIMVVLRILIPSIDERLLFNMIFYLIGLVSAPYFDWKFKKAPFMKLVWVLFFFSMLVIAHYCFPCIISKYRRVLGGLGVFAILFCCDGLSGLVFKKETIMASIIKNVSFASMACYMFHRLFFWAGEIVWNPSDHWLKWLYMAGVVFPIMLVLSFYTQKLYDKLVKNLVKV